MRHVMPSAVVAVLGPHGHGSRCRHHRYGGLVVPRSRGRASDSEWGAIVAEGRELTAQWWVSTFPGVAILTVALSANFVGDGLHDAIDPRLRIR